MRASPEVEGEEENGKYDKVSKREIFMVSVILVQKKGGRKTGAAFDILHPSFKRVLERADEYLPADECLRTGCGGENVALERR